MPTAQFYVHLVPTFADKDRTKLKRIRADRIVQTRPKPDTSGMWIEVNIEVPSGVFEHLIPVFNARMNEKALEKMLETSELHTKLVGEDPPES